jgi:hypothetical protein
MDSRDHVSQLWHFFCAAFWLTRGSAGTWPFAAISISSDGFFSFWPRLLHAQQDKTACAADTLLYPKPGSRVVFFLRRQNQRVFESRQGESRFFEKTSFLLHLGQPFASASLAFG